MRFIYKNIFPSFFFFFCLQITVTAQEKEFWVSEKEPLQISKLSITQQKILPKSYNVLSLNVSSFQKALRVKGKGTTTPKIVSFPNEKGDLETFRVTETSVMETELQKKFPNLKSYTGYNINDPQTKVYFSTSPYGINAVLYYEGKSPVFIDPLKDKYIQYQAKNTERSSFYCAVNSEDMSNDISHKELRTDNDDYLRSFRLAVMTTGEYSQFHLDLLGINSSASELVKKEAVLSAVQNAITRVNSIYERDLGVRLILVNNNNDILFLDSDTDGLSNSNPSKLIVESQTVIDSKIGFNNYDIGHTFSTGGGGLATLPSACTNYKAQGITGVEEPVGDPFYIDYVCHEIGHQFGATHTFNGNSGNCSGGNRSDSFAVEPGSGSTIMAYAGICPPENVQQNSDAYFNYVSIAQMVNYIQSLSCATTANINNSAPVVEAVSSYTLPILTPFALTAVASDSDNDSLTYTWEQLDTEIVNVPLQSTETEGPAFRSMMPSSNPSRFFPNKTTVNSNLLKNDWEVLPAVSRTMEFAVTVRDNHLGGGRTASQKTTLTFTKDAGPFAVTSQKNEENWSGGSIQTITWDVANTDKNPINCSYVNILFSDDGGETYSYNIAESLPNSGSATVFIPNITTNEGRIKVESIGNVFYAINQGTLKVTQSVISETEFIVRVQDQTCPTQQDGSVSIIAQRQGNFTTTINGENYNFTKNIIIGNLAAGNYDFCISDSGNNQKCFSEIIGTGKEIKVEYTSNYPSIHFEVKEGTPPFYVFVNDTQVLKTEEETFDISILNGDLITINTDVSCEGSYQQTILEFDEIRAFPNPSDGNFEISVPKTSLSKVKISLFNTIGQLILQDEYSVSSKRISIDISYLPSGIYIAKVHSEEEKSIKLIKQ